MLHWLCVFMLNRGRGWWWIWNWPPGLLWSLPAGWWDNLVWYLPQSIPYGLPRPGHGKGPWGHVELPTLRKDIIPNFWNYSFLRTVEVILVNWQQNGNQPSHHIITYLLGEKKKNRIKFITPCDFWDKAYTLSNSCTQIIYYFNLDFPVDLHILILGQLLVMNNPLIMD